VNGNGKRFYQEDCNHIRFSKKRPKLRVLRELFTTAHWQKVLSQLNFCCTVSIFRAYLEYFRGKEGREREKERKECGKGLAEYSVYLTDQGGVGKGWPYVVGSVKFPIPMNFCAREIQPLKETLHSKGNK